MSFDLQYLDPKNAEQLNFYFKDRDLFCVNDGLERQTVTLKDFNTIYKHSFFNPEQHPNFYLVNEQLHRMLVARAEHEGRNSKLSGIEEDVLKVIRAAIEMQVSDIHIIREDIACSIKFRINGSLMMHREILSHEADSWMFVLYNVMATTKETTWNRRIPQDANVVLNLDSGAYRLRYAHMPLFGESGQNYRNYSAPSKG